jgi:hypothetical protein
MTTFAKACTLTIFDASYLAPMKPAAYNKISVIKIESGTTIDIGLNNDFKLIGNSALPAYPGFNVINTAQSGNKA